MRMSWDFWFCYDFTYCYVYSSPHCPIFHWLWCWVFPMRYEGFFWVCNACIHHFLVREHINILALVPVYHIWYEVMFQEIIDIEWGAFGDNGVLDFFKQWADFQVDKNSNHVGSFTWVLPTLLMTCFPHGFVRDLHRPLRNKKYFFLYSRIDVFENWFIYLI